MIRAAGILYITRDRSAALFLKRGEGTDHTGEWCIPGGKIEEGETPEQAAIRESQEEAGSSVPTGQLALLTRTIQPAAPQPMDLPGADVSTLALPQDEVDFTTFVRVVDAPFDVTLSDESAGYAWAPPTDPPIPLHPGVRISLDRLMGDELDVAKMMAAGELVSPQPYENVTLFDIRLTGTGVAYRSKGNEFAFRDPELYITPRFLERCNGLPVIWEHPDGGKLLDGEELSERVIGTVFLPYIKGEEVWAIAKVWDQAAAFLMTEGQLSTSPAVNFTDPSVNTKLTLENGELLLIEGKPSFLDHVAVCRVGVWDKGRAPSGVNVVQDSAAMETEEQKKAKADSEAKAKADRDAKFDAFMDSITGKLDSVSKSIADSAASSTAIASRMDKLESRLDSMKPAAKADSTESELANEAASTPVAGDMKEAEAKNASLADSNKKDSAKKDAAKKDEDGDAKKEKEKDKDEDKKDAAKKDAAPKKDEDKDKDEKDKNKDDSVKADSADLDARIRRAMEGYHRSDADHAALAAAQSKADSAFAPHGRNAPIPVMGESPFAYRRRMAKELQAHSKQWKDADLSVFSGAAFDTVERQIYTDAIEASRRPTDIPFGTLREVKHRDITGREITEFKGEPRSWMSPHFGMPLQTAKFTPSQSNH